MVNAEQKSRLDAARSQIDAVRRELSTQTEEAGPVPVSHPKAEKHGAHVKKGDKHEEEPVKAAAPSTLDATRKALDDAIKALDSVTVG